MFKSNKREVLCNIKRMALFRVPSRPLTKGSYLANPFVVVFTGFKKHGIIEVSKKDRRCRDVPRARRETKQT